MIKKKIMKYADEMPPVVVLAGGFGTRLASVVNDRPKIMAPIKGIPFIAYLFAWFQKNSVQRVCLSLGYRAEQVLAYINTNSHDFLQLEYAVEEKVLGTAGGVAHCLHSCSMFQIQSLSSQEIVIVNGDSWVTLDMLDFVAKARASSCDISICSVEVDEASRYGLLDIDDQSGLLKGFKEKSQENSQGWINAGVYFFRNNALTMLSSLKQGSIEFDVFSNIEPTKIFVYKSDAEFIDIGTPESYRLAEEIIQSVE